MIMADVFKIVFLVLGTLCVFVAYWLAAAALVPRWIARARGAYEERPVRATLVGIVVGIPLSLVGIGLMSDAPNGGLKVVGALVVSVPILLALGGSAGLALRIGAGLALPDDERAPWRRVLRGGIVLVLTFLLPVVGWFLVLPWTLVSGVGAAVLATRARRQLVTPANAPRADDRASRTMPSQELSPARAADDRWRRPATQTAPLAGESLAGASPTRDMLR